MKVVEYQLTKVWEARKLFLFAGILILLESLFLPGVSAQIDEGNIVFRGNHVRIYFQPRIRASTDNTVRAVVEIARLNNTVNFFDNYLEYLIKLKKIASDTIVNIDFSPEGGDETFSSQRIFVRDLGFNSILKEVNRFLAHQPGTSVPHLISDKEALKKIGDHLQRREATVEEAMGFSNFSIKLQSISPDTDFAVLGSKGMVSLRPQEEGNSIIYLPREATPTVLLDPQKKGEFDDLLPSPDGKYLAFTENQNPRVMVMGNKNVIEIFPGAPQKNLLDWEWSPKLNRLGGIVVDQKSLSREIFLFDAEKEKRSLLSEKNSEISGDYQHAFPYWADDGEKVLFCSGDEINLFDLSKNKVFPKVVCSNGNIAEILWAQDGSSFAYVEFEGQARNRNEFDDRDFNGSSLHKINLEPDGKFVEDEGQRVLSSHTIKLVSFWDDDRVMYLEGNLRSQTVRSCIWDVKPSLTLHLTPPPSVSKIGNSLEETGPTEMAMDYCYCFKNLDGKFKNLYDSGFGHQNQVFVPKMKNIWFLGIKPPEGVKKQWLSYNLRIFPYPFLERNQVLFSPLSADEVNWVLNFVKMYMIRNFVFRQEEEKVFFLTNSPGPLTIWGGDIANFYRQKLPKPIFSESEEKGPPIQVNNLPPDDSSKPMQSMPDLPFN